MPPTPNSTHGGQEDTRSIEERSIATLPEYFRKLAERYRTVYEPKQGYAPGKWPSPEYPYAPGYHPVPEWLRATMENLGAREAKGFPHPEFEPISGFVEGKLGYLPGYWEDPKRIANWYHVMQTMPKDAVVPAWMDRDKLTAAYKYLEQKNGNTPWYQWKWLNKDDPGRQFLQSFDMPPANEMFPEELYYEPGKALETPTGLPIPGDARFEALPGWQKVLVNLFGTGPFVGEQLLPTSPIAGPAISGAVRAAPQGAIFGGVIGGFFGGVPGLVAGTAIGTGIGGGAGAALTAIQKRRELGVSVKTDPLMEQVLTGLLGVLQWPAQQIEQVIGVGIQTASSLKDPEKYGPVSEVFGNLPAAYRAGQLTYEAAPARTGVINLLEGLSARIEGRDPQTIETGQVWDLGDPQPHLIGPDTPETSGHIWQHALAEARRVLMTTNAAPRDVLLEMGKRYGIGGELWNLAAQSVLDPLNFLPVAEVEAARAYAKYTKNAALLEAVRRTNKEAFTRRGGVKVLEHFQHILKTETPVETITAQGRFSQWFAGVDEKGEPTILQPSKIKAPWPINKVLDSFGLTPKARATRTIMTTADGVKFILLTSEDPSVILKNWQKIANTPGPAAQELGLRFLNAPDGHLLIMAMRDFNVETLNKFAAQWNATRGQRELLGAITEMLGFDGTRQHGKTLHWLGDPEQSDAMWGKLTQRMAEDAAQGDTAAQALQQMVANNLLDKAKLQDMLKVYLKDGLPSTANQWKWQVYDAWLDHITKWTVDKIGVKIEPAAYRMSNVIKSAASLLLLDGNPLYLINNVTNNAFTQFADGTFGLKSEKSIMSFWREFGVLPFKLEQAMGGPAELGGQTAGLKAPDIAKLSMVEAAEKGIDADVWLQAKYTESNVKGPRKLAEITKGDGGMAAADRAIGEFRQKVGIFSRLSSYAERLQGMNGFTKATQQWWSRAWRRALGFDRAAGNIEDALGYRLAGEIYGYIESSMNYEAIEKKLLTEATLKKNVEMVVDEAARATGQDPVKVLDLMRQADAVEFMNERLVGVKTPEGVRLAFDDLNRHVQEHINTVHRSEVEIKAGEIAEMIKAGDLTGLHDAWYDLNRKLEEWWTSHVLRWGDAIDEAEALFKADKTSAAEQVYKNRRANAAAESRRIMDMQTATVDGLVEGLRVKGVDTAEKYTLGLRRQIAQNRLFFETAADLWDGFWQGVKDGTNETGAGRAVADQLARDYDNLMRDTIDVQKFMDDAIIEATVKVNPEAAERLSVMLEDIRNHKLRLMEQEAAIRDARYDLLYYGDAAGLNGRTAAGILMRAFAEFPELLSSFEGLIKNLAKRGDMDSKAMLEVRRQIYLRWTEDVKIKGIRDYYEMRTVGITEAVDGGPQRPADAELPAQPRITTEDTGIQVEEARVAELVASGENPNDARRIATEQAAAARVGVDLTKETSLNELYKLARDAGISTSTEEGKPFYGHLLNALNKDLGLNDSPLKIKSVRDLTDLPGDGLNQARQALVNRAVKHQAYVQEAELTKLNVEALRTLDDGIDDIGQQKLARIAEANGLEEASRMSKQDVWDWMTTRRARGDTYPFEAATPTEVRRQVYEFFRTHQAGDEQTNLAMQVLEGHAKALGLSIEELAARYGMTEDDGVFSEALMRRYYQEGHGMDHPWVKQAQDYFGIETNPDSQAIGFIMPDGTGLKGLKAHMEVGEPIHGMANLPAIDEFIRNTGAIRFRVEQGNFMAIEMMFRPSDAQLAFLTRKMLKHGAGVVEVKGMNGRTVLARVMNAAYGKVTPEIVGDVFAAVDKAAPRALYQLEGPPIKKAPTFYSFMERVVEAKMPERMPADQLLNFLKAQGVKPDEIKWSGLEEFIAGRQSAAQLAGPPEGFTGTQSEWRAQPSGQVIEKSEVLGLIRDLEPKLQIVEYPTHSTELRAAKPLAGEAEPVWEHYLIGMGDDPARRSPGGGAVLNVWELFQPVDGSHNQVIRFLIRQDPPGQERYSLRASLGEFRNASGLGPPLPENFEASGNLHIPNADPFIGGWDYQRVFDSLEATQAAALSLGWYTESTGARWDRYSYPGGTNYREVVLHLPSFEDTSLENMARINDAVFAKFPAAERITEINSYNEARLRFYDAGPEIAYTFDAHEAWLRTIGGGDASGLRQDWDTHFHEPNVLGWARIKDRVLPDGRRVMFIEELQSDQGRRIRDLRQDQRAFDLSMERRQLRQQRGTGDNKAIEDRLRELDVQLAGKDIPTVRPFDEPTLTMPWEKTWHELVLRKLMSQAAEEGYDALGWNTAEGVFQAETNMSVGEASQESGTSIQWVTLDTDEGTGYLQVFDAEGNIEEQGVYSEDEARHIVGEAAWENLQEDETIRRRSGERWRHYAGALADYLIQGYEAEPYYDGPKSFGLNTLTDPKSGRSFEWWTDPPSNPGVGLLRETTYAGDRPFTRFNDAQLAKELGEAIANKLISDPAFSEDRKAIDIDEYELNEIANKFDYTHFTAELELESYIENLGDATVSTASVAGAGEGGLSEQFETMLNGFRGFYEENQVPQAINRIGKPFGAKAEPMEFVYTQGATSFVSNVDGNTYRVIPDEGSYRYQVFDNNGNPIDAFRNIEQLATFLGLTEDSVFKKFTNETAPGFMVRINDAMRNGVEYDGQKLFQQNLEPGQQYPHNAKGMTTMLTKSRRIVKALQNPDFTTGVHELAHTFRADLLPSEMDVVVNWGNKELGLKIEGHSGGRFLGEETATVALEEAFANGFIKYFVEGVAPIKALANIFAKFKAWILEVIGSIEGSEYDIKLNDQMRQLYADQLGARAPPDQSFRFDATQPAPAVSGRVDTIGTNVKTVKLRHSVTIYVPENANVGPEVYKLIAKEFAGVAGGATVTHGDGYWGDVSEPVHLVSSYVAAADLQALKRLANNWSKKLRGMGEEAVAIGTLQDGRNVLNILSESGANESPLSLFQMAYEKRPGSQISQEIASSNDPLVRNILNGMGEAQDAMIELARMIDNRERPVGLDIAPSLVDALKTIYDMRAGAHTQASVLEAGPLTTNANQFIRALVTDLMVLARSPSAISEVIRNYAKMVELLPRIDPTIAETGAYPRASEVWVMARNRPAIQDLFQLPLEVEANAFDQVPPARMTSEMMSEAWIGMAPTVDSIRDLMAAPDGFVQDINLEEARARLTPEQQSEFSRWVKSLRGQMAQTKYGAMKWGEHMRDFGLLDYTAQRGIDQILQVPFQFPFWPSRTYLRWMMRTNDFPALMATFARINELRRKQELAPGFPRRLWGTVRLPLPFQPDWMGEGVWIDPLKIFPLMNLLNTADRVQMSENKLNKRAAYIIQKQTADGAIPVGDAENAITTASGPIWDAAIAQARTEQEAEFADPLDYLGILSNLMLPYGIAHEVIRGTPERIGPLPLTRAVKTITGGLGIGGPGGVNLEGPIRKALHLPIYDRFEDYRIERMLASMVADGDIDVRASNIAAQERQGPIYDEAVRRVSQARFFGAYGNPAFWFGMGGDTFPTGELAQRRLGQEFSLAITAKQIGDSTALNRFFEKYPEYEARLASFDTPEERQRAFLVDEIWMKYRELGSANKELVRLQLGEQFQQMFLDRETRTYENIPVEALAAWAHAIGGYVPDNATNRVEYKDLAPDIGLLPPQYAKIVDTFRDTRNKKFPNWFAVQQGYFFSGPSGSAERKAYLAQWPELEEYWDWRDDQLDGNAFLKGYYNRYDLENRDAGSLGSLSIPEILSNPILMRQLGVYQTTGQPLTSGAQEELRRIFQLLQSPGGDFQEWVEQLNLQPQSANTQIGY